MSTADPDQLLDAWDDALAQWSTSASFHAAVAAVSAAFGYATTDVERQLEHVIARCRASVMRELLDREASALADLPARVLVLTSGGVPGLVLESIASALAVGAVAVVRPSRDEHVLDHLFGELPDDVLARIEIVDGDVPWTSVDAAIVHGSDETIALVRSKLRPAAAARVAAYGSRQGVAVVTLGGVAANATYARRIADDVLTFRQRGCMSPSWLFVLGDDEQRRIVISDLGRELALARTRHLAPGVHDDAIAQRRSSDADVLGAIAAGLAPDPRVLHAGDARLTVVGVGDADALFANVAPLGSLLQTAVLVAGRDERPGLVDVLQRAGCSRVVDAGWAHRPEPLWPQDGIGRVAPLLAQ